LTESEGCETSDVCGGVVVYPGTLADAVALLIVVRVALFAAAPLALASEMGSADAEVATASVRARAPRKKGAFMLIPSAV
jgi:hypothetical protein